MLALAVKSSQHLSFPQSRLNKGVMAFSAPTFQLSALLSRIIVDSAFANLKGKVRL